MSEHPQRANTKLSRIIHLAVRQMIFPFQSIILLSQLNVMHIIYLKKNPFPILCILWGKRCLVRGEFNMKPNPVTIRAIMMFLRGERLLDIHVLAVIDSFWVEKWKGTCAWMCMYLCVRPCGAMIQKCWLAIRQHRPSHWPQHEIPSCRGPGSISNFWSWLVAAGRWSLFDLS